MMKTTNKIKHTEIGLIPEDWEVEEIQNIADIRNTLRKSHTLTIEMEPKNRPTPWDEII